MTAFEYRVERFQLSASNYKDVEAALNRFGDDGWELDRFLELGEGLEYVLLKRSK